MKLYEIDNRIIDLLSMLEPDAETGEIPGNYEELFKELDALQMKRQDILSYLAKLVLNTRSDIASLKAEEKRLADRRKVLENRDKHLMAILDRECMGQKTDCGVATVCYRKTEKVEISDFEQALKFLSENNHSDCFRTFDPEIAKTEVKDLIKSGTAVPGIEIVEGQSCSLR